jgi:hypothetical protein
LTGRPLRSEQRHTIADEFWVTPQIAGAHIDLFLPAELVVLSSSIADTREP